jgi:hypothetical protein
MVTEPPRDDKDGERSFAQKLAEQARTDGIDLIGPGGLLAGLTVVISRDPLWPTALRSRSAYPHRRTVPCAPRPLHCRIVGVRNRVDNRKSGACRRLLVSHARGGRQSDRWALSTFGLSGV